MPTADLQLTRDFRKYKSMDIFENAHLGESFLAKHKFSFMQKDGQWFYAQNHLKESSCIVWPCKLEKIKGTTFEYFTPTTTAKEITLVTIWDLKQVTARSVGFKSWAWQQNEIGIKQTKHLDPAIRIFSLTGNMPFFDLACLKAFWKVSRTTAEKLAANAGQKASKDLTDFEWFYDIMKGRLKKSDHKMLELLSQRMTSEGLDEHYKKRVMEMDDAVDVLEDADAKLAEAEQQKFEDKAKVHALFVNEFKAKIASLPKAAGADKKEIGIRFNILLIREFLNTNKNRLLC